MQTYGSKLIQNYNQYIGTRLKEVAIYVDPIEGKLKADVVLENGYTIPLLIDIDPDWEKECT